MNAKEEVYKILKYQKRMDQTGGAKREEYKDKIREHRKNLTGAGYRRDEIERMIQRGGAALDDVLNEAKKVEELVNTRCDEAAAAVRKTGEEREKLEKQKAAEKTQLEKERADEREQLEKERNEGREQLAKEREAIAAEKQRLEEEKNSHAVLLASQGDQTQINEVRQIIGNILKKLDSSTCPLPPPPLI